MRRQFLVELAFSMHSVSLSIQKIRENNRDRQDRPIRSVPKADGAHGTIHLVENELVAFQVDRLGLGKNFDRAAQHDSRYRLRWRENGEQVSGDRHAGTGLRHRLFR